MAEFVDQYAVLNRYARQENLPTVDTNSSLEEIQNLILNPKLDNMDDIQRWNDLHAALDVLQDAAQRTQHDQQIKVRKFSLQEHLKAFKDRQKHWDDLIKSLMGATPPTLSPLQQYKAKKNEFLGLHTTNKMAASLTRHLYGALPSQTKLQDKLRRKGLGHESDLVKLYAEFENSKIAMRNIKDGFISGVSNKTLMKEVVFLREIETLLEKGKTKWALQRLDAHSPPLIKQLFMSKARRAEYELARLALIKNVKEYQVQHDKNRGLAKACKMAEQHVAKSVQKLLKDMYCSRLLKTMDPGVRADLDKAAEKNAGLKMLLKYARSGVIPAAGIIVHDLHHSKDISLESIRETIQSLEKNFVSKQLDNRAKTVEAENKQLECKNFLRACVLARDCELKEPNKKLHTRHDLTADLSKIIANPSAYTEDQIKIVVKQCTDRAEKWIDGQDQENVRLDAKNLADIAHFDAKAMHPDALAHFERADRVERGRTTLRDKFDVAWEGFKDGTKRLGQRVLESPGLQHMGLNL